MDVLEDIYRLKAAFNERFKERSEEINCALLALLSGEHLLFLGPPGTAKSMLSRSVCEAIDGDYFYYLLTRFTTPEEIFGPLSLKALQEDDYQRKTDGYLPSAHIAFLDEIFKSNSSILNSLLTILNERKFHNGQRVMAVPLLSLFAASNEMPEEDENLEALYDRFLFRCHVGYIRHDSAFREFLFDDARASADGRISMDGIMAIQDLASRVHVSPEVESIVVELRRQLIEKGFVISDRRWKKMVGVLKVAAASSERDEVDRSMLLLMQHMAWDRPGQKEAIRDMLMDVMISGGESLEGLKKDVEDMLTLVQRSLDFKFPMPIRCYDCGAIFYGLRHLGEHKKRYPEHLYYDPYRISLHLRYLRYDDMIRMLRDECKWNFLEEVPDRVRPFSVDFSDLKDKFARTFASLESDMARLSKLADSNPWLTAGDRDGLMSKYRLKVRMLREVEGALSAIETMLEQDKAEAPAGAV